MIFEPLNDFDEKVKPMSYAVFMEKNHCRPDKYKLGKTQ